VSSLLFEASMLVLMRSKPFFIRCDINSMNPPNTPMIVNVIVNAGNQSIFLSPRMGSVVDLLLELCGDVGVDGGGAKRTVAEEDLDGL